MNTPRKPRYSLSIATVIMLAAQLSCFVVIPYAIEHLMPKFDEYGLPYRDGGTSIQTIRFCPWCGNRLPESKRLRWFDELARLGFDDPFVQDIPEEFRTDTWWRSKAAQHGLAAERDALP